MAGDLERLQGTWNVTSLETDGRSLPASMFDGSSIVIEGSAFTSVGMGATYKGTLELGGSKTRKILQLRFTAGHAAGTRHIGIYKLDAATWTICLATNGSRAPRAFATRRGSGFALQTLQRSSVGSETTKSPNPLAAVSPTRHVDAESDVSRSGVATEWEGEWSMVAGVFNGAAMGEDMIKWCSRITRGDVTSVVAGPRVMLRARFALDHSKTPHAVDYKNLEGPSKGKAQAGIFELSGDSLKVCMSAPGKPRPSGFASKAGDGRSYTTWRLARK